MYANYFDFNVMFNLSPITARLTLWLLCKMNKKKQIQSKLVVCKQTHWSSAKSIYSMSLTLFCISGANYTWITCPEPSQSSEGAVASL